MARFAASLISAGAAKSGKPCARFTAPHFSARRVISRITDSVNSPGLAGMSVGMILYDRRAEKSRCGEIQLPAVYPRRSGRDNLPDLSVRLRAIINGGL